MYTKYNNVYGYSKRFTFGDIIKYLTNAIKSNDKITAIDMFYEFKDDVPLLKQVLFDIALEYTPNIHLLNGLYEEHNDIKKLFKYIIILCCHYKTHDHIDCLIQSSLTREDMIKKNKISLVSPGKNDMLQVLSDKLYVYLCRNEVIEYINVINKIKNKNKYNYIDLYNYCNKNYKFLCCLNMYLTKYYKYMHFSYYDDVYYNEFMKAIDVIKNNDINITTSTHDISINDEQTIMNNVNDINTNASTHDINTTANNDDNMIYVTNNDIEQIKNNNSGVYKYNDKYKFINDINIITKTNDKNTILLPIGKTYIDKHNEDMMLIRLHLKMIDRVTKLKYKKGEEITYEKNKYKKDTQEEINLFNEYKECTIKHLLNTKRYQFFLLRKHTIYYDEILKLSDDVKNKEYNITITPFMTNKILSNDDINIVFKLSPEEYAFKYYVINISDDVMNKKLFKNINNFKNKTNMHNMFLMKGPYKDYTNVYKEISANKIIKKLMNNAITKKHIIEINNEIYIIENIDEHIINEYRMNKSSLDNNNVHKQNCFSILFNKYIVDKDITKYNSSEQKQYIKILLLKNILGCNNNLYNNIIYYNNSFISLNDTISISKNELTNKQHIKKHDNKSILSDEEINNFKQVLNNNKSYIEMLTNNYYKLFDELHEQNTLLDDNNILFYGFNGNEKTNIIKYIKKNINKYHDINNWTF